MRRAMQFESKNVGNVYLCRKYVAYIKNCKHHLPYKAKNFMKSPFSIFYYVLSLHENVFVGYSSEGKLFSSQVFLKISQIDIV